jgi:hypothetical protein
MFDDRGSLGPVVPDIAEEASKKQRTFLRGYKLHAAISEQDFIGLARASMRKDGFTAEDIAGRWSRCGGRLP